MSLQQSETLTSFKREYIIENGNKIGYGFAYKVVVTGTSIVFEFGEGDKKVCKIIAATFQNELFIYNGGIEILTIKIVDKLGLGPEIKITVCLPFQMEQTCAMIGAGFGVFTLRQTF